jgi:Ca2+-binding EF-hand superfamily protein
MINGINSMNGAMTMMRSGSMERHQPPGKDVFQLADADSDGQVSGSELETLAKGIEEVTGTSIDLDEALTNFDADQDGSLSGAELKGLMDSNGFSPPGMLRNDKGEAGRMQPPPPSSEQVLSAYARNTGEDKIDQLIEFLKDQNGDDEEISSIDVIS